MVVAWDLSDVSEKEVDKLETKLQEYTDEKTSLDEQISQQRAKILELSKEIGNLEKHKVGLAWEKSLPTREVIDQKAIKGVEHAEVALNLGLEVESMEETQDRLMARLNFSNIKLEKFKSKFHV